MKSARQGMRLWGMFLSWGAALAPAAAQGQRHPSDWPRRPDTGQVEFVGMLPWPDSVTTPDQRQVLTRQWFAANLTQMPANQCTRVLAKNGQASYAGLPQEASLDSVWSCPGPYPEKVTYRLFYHVALAPTPAGLTYRLHHFEWAEIGPDFGSTSSLEALLPQFGGQLRGFQRRLTQALAGWQHGKPTAASE
jgi:hypothetical protein